MKTVKRKSKDDATKKTLCQICKKVVNGSSFKFKSHLHQHNVVKSRFKCSYCSKEYFRRDTFEKHVAVHTGIKRYHTCDYCDRGFVDKRNLISHLRIHDECGNKPRQFKCLACGSNYCEERLLKYHIRKQHFNLNGKTTTYDNKNANETWVEHVMESEICVQMTKIDKNTIVIKKSPTTVKCEDSNETERTQFQKYMTSVFATTNMSHYSKAVCDYCNKEMLKKSLISHIRERHLKLKRFKCEVCKESFSRHYLMVNHKCGQFRIRKRK